MPSGWTAHWNEGKRKYYYYSDKAKKSTWNLSRCGVDGELLPKGVRAAGLARAAAGAAAAAASVATAGPTMTREAVGDFSEADIQRAIAESLRYKGGKKTRKRGLKKKNKRKRKPATSKR